MEIEMIATNSSTVPLIGYDEKNATMLAQFGSGTIYQYLDISQEEFDSVNNSHSTGSKLREVVKGKEYSKL